MSVQRFPNLPGATVPDLARLRRSGARCLQALTGAPYQRCVHAIDGRDDLDDPQTVGRVLVVLNEIGVGGHVKDRQTVLAFDDLVVDVLAARSRHDGMWDAQHLAYTWPVDSSGEGDWWFAVLWASDWSQLHTFEPGHKATGVGPTVLADTGLRSLPDDPWLAALRLQSTLDDLCGEGQRARRRRGEQAAAMLAEAARTYPQLTGFGLADVLAYADDVAYGWLQSSDVGPVDDGEWWTLATDLEEVASTRIGPAHIADVVATVGTGVFAWAETSRAWLTTADGTAHGGPQPVAEAAEQARRTGEPVTVTYRADGWDDLPAGTVDPCDCACHDALVDDSRWDQLHGRWLRSAGCRCRSGYVLADADAVVAGMRAATRGADGVDGFVSAVVDDAPDGRVWSVLAWAPDGVADTVEVPVVSGTWLWVRS